MDTTHDQGDVLSATTRRVMGNLKMRHLRLLANMQRYGSLTKVAGIMGISQPAVTKMLAELFAYMQVPAPTPVIETYSTEVMYGVISQNESIVSVVPQTIADDMIRRGGVAVVPWELDWELPPLTLIRRARKTPLAAEEAFATVVRELCAQVDPSQK